MGFLSSLSFTVCVFLPSLVGYVGSVLPYVEHRPGLAELNDPLLNFLPTFDTSLVLTGISAYHLVSALYRGDGTSWLRYLCCCWLNMLCRSTFMLMCPLKVHPGHFVLRDTVVQWFLPNSQPFVNDLFFSGHFSNALIHAHVYPSKLNWLLVPLTPLSLLLCKAHYTVDLLVVPFVLATIVPLGDRLAYYLLAAS